MKTGKGHDMTMDDTLLVKLVSAEHDALRDVTGQPENVVPAYEPVAFTMRGNVD